ncbi:MAG: tol-pal system protein YbgF [Deltaproteobacteria bacterium]|nr:tol-pal system protein YbgF [Deltaproteobacteria bacterium]MBW2150605.1 tol-pal system protein YbgF [Deltaproteobacteria bacterium]
MTTIKSILFLVLGSIVFLDGCVTEQEFFALDQRLAVLEQENEDRAEDLNLLNQRIGRIESRLEEFSQIENQESQNLRNRLAESHVTLDQIREELQKLRGQIETTQYLVKQQQNLLKRSETERFTKLDDIEKISRQTRSRVARIEQYLNLVEASKQPAGKSPPPSITRIKETASESELYKAAKQAYDKGDYETAREKFEAYLEKYPKSSKADNAQFWIGEIYYREKWYEKAILEYQKVIDNYPKGNKVPASLLKQGLSFLNLGDKANSRLILKELISKYPKSSEATIAKRKLKEIQ